MTMDRQNFANNAYYLLFSHDHEIGLNDDDDADDDDDDDDDGFSIILLQYQEQIP